MKSQIIWEGRFVEDDVPPLRVRVVATGWGTVAAEKHAGEDALGVDRWERLEGDLANRVCLAGVYHYLDAKAVEDDLAKVRRRRRTS